MEARAAMTHLMGLPAVAAREVVEAILAPLAVEAVLQILLKVRSLLKRNEG